MIRNSERRAFSKNNVYPHAQIKLNTPNKDYYAPWPKANINPNTNNKNFT